MPNLRRYGLGPIERAMVDIIGNDDLMAIRNQIQERRRDWDVLKKDGDALAQFLKDTCRESMPRNNQIHTEKLRDLTSPAGEISQIIWKYNKKTNGSMLPAENARIMTSVPTAGSWQKGEYNTLFEALGLKFASCETFKTCVRDPTSNERICGRNGHKIHKDDLCIEYDQNATRDTWPQVSETLYHRLVAASKAEKSSVDAIFHWGCISHNEQLVANHKVGVEEWAKGWDWKMNHKDAVEGWEWHEHWNILYCIAMARHALDFLKTGGRLVLKVRTFESAETLGLISLISCAFEESHVFGDPHQLAECAMFVGNGFLGSDDDTVEKVKKSLQTNTRYQLDQIFCDKLSAEDKFRITLQDAVAVREKMRCDHDYVTLIMLQIIYHVEQCLTGSSSQFPYDQFKCTLQELSDMDPIPMDKRWLQDTINKIDIFIKKHQTDKKLQDTLSTFVNRWQLTNFSVTDDNNATVNHRDKHSHRHTTKLHSLLQQLKAHRASSFDAPR